MSAILESILYIQGQFQGQIFFFQQMKIGRSVIPHFHVISTRQSISEIILIIQCRKYILRSRERKYKF